MMNPSGHFKQVWLALFQISGAWHDTQKPVSLVYGVSVGQMQLETVEFQTVPLVQVLQLIVD
jgi:hypothetical protein